MPSYIVGFYEGAGSPGKRSSEACLIVKGMAAHDACVFKHLGGRILEHGPLSPIYKPDYTIPLLFVQHIDDFVVHIHYLSLPPIDLRNLERYAGVNGSP